MFNSPQPARTIGRVFDTPPRAPEGRATVRRCRPTTRRQSSTAVPRPRRADRCPSKTEGLTVRGKDEPASPKGQRRSRRFAISHSLAIAVWAKWRRVVGRHARQIRGELVRCDKYLSLPLGYKSDVPLLYPLDRYFSEDYRTARCSIARSGAPVNDDPNGSPF